MSNAYQTRIMQNTTFSKKEKLLNSEEYELFKILLDVRKEVIKDIKNNIQISPQVNIQSFITCCTKDAYKNNYDDTNAYSLYNAKSVDFLISTQDFTPFLVIEYYGSGHFGDNNNRKKVEDNDCLKTTIFKDARIELCVIEYSQLCEDRNILCNYLYQTIIDEYNKCFFIN